MNAPRDIGSRRRRQRGRPQGSAWSIAQARGHVPPLSGERESCGSLRANGTSCLQGRVKRAPLIPCKKAFVMDKPMQVRAFAQDGPAARPELRIRRVDAIAVAVPLAKPLAMSGVTVKDARNLLVRIEAADGTVGWGEAASAPTMTGDTLGGLVAAVRDHLAPALIDRDAWMRGALCRALAAILLGNSGAHSAVEMALIDLAGQAAGLPVIDLLGGAVRTEVAPMWLLGNATAEEDIAEARARRAGGFISSS